MPHMAPMNWVSLFLLFSIIFIIFNSMNFFSFKYTPNKKMSSSHKIPINWKW